MIEYDEFSFFHENAQEYGLPFTEPHVERVRVDVAEGSYLSALRWGTGDPEFVFLHGGAQNAHTWDTVALAIDRPLVAIDLPGHGHSGPGRKGSLDLRANAHDVATAVRRWAPRARGVIGMSLGGLTTLALSQEAPDLVRSVTLVDVTPGVNRQKSSQIAAFINGPETFESFDAILERTIEFNPTRTVSSLRRGVLHNAEQQADGTWVWRYRRFAEGQTDSAPMDFGTWWDAVSRLKVPLMLVRGMRSESVVSDEDEAELVRLQPGVRVAHVAEAGHSVQGDDPLTLARLITEFVGT